MRFTPTPTTLCRGGRHHLSPATFTMWVCHCRRTLGTVRFPDSEQLRSQRTHERKPSVTDDCENSLLAALLADASVAAVEWIVTGRWTTHLERLDIQWPADSERGYW
jgi:hypothetical protein